jgi:hypothetical protein
VSDWKDLKMDEFDTALHSRLGALEASVPISARPEHRRVRRRFSLGTTLGIAAACLLAGAVTGSAVTNQVRSYPGLFGPDEIFHCSKLQEMAPPEAAAALAGLGYRVTWQVESPTEQTRLSEVPPDEGFIVGGALVDGGLLVVVQTGPRGDWQPQPC